MIRMTFEATKWVACDDPAQAAGPVVRAALAGRLAAVEHYLEATTPDEVHDPEHVHQLRVATRRADAAVRAFADFLPPRKARKMRRALRKIRRAAAEARDHDVMAMRYATPCADVPDAAQEWLWSRIVDARRAAHPGVDEVYRRRAAGNFAARSQRLLDRVRWRGSGAEPAFAALAVEAVVQAGDECFGAARGRPRRAAALHLLRIAAKRFRYAIELFAAAAPPMRDDVYSQIERVQEMLGKANDHAVAAERIARWRKHCARGGSALPDGIDELVKREKKKAAAARDAFLKWWTRDKAEALERRFAAIAQAAVANSPVNAAKNTESQ